MLRLIATSIVCCAFAQGQSTTRQIPLPEGISGARCVADDGRRYSSQRNARALPVECVGAPEAVVRCDFDGGEPLDLTLAALCAADRVPAVQAPLVLVRLQERTELTAEWVRFAGLPDTGATVVARRALTLPPPEAQNASWGTQVLNRVELPVAPRDDRFITFSRPGASPITVHADTLGVGRWTLPNARPGGELVLRVPRAPITAIKYHLVGGADVVATPVGTVASFRAVSGGDYELVPEYEGGLQGQRTPVHIQQGKVTFVALPEEQVGGAQIVADPLLCDAPGTLAILAIRSNSETGVSAIETLLTLPTRKECVQTVAGLRPGEYQVSLKGERGRLASRKFQIAAQSVTPVFLSPGSVHVSGQVSLNGIPLPDVVIRFNAVANRAAQDLIRTDPEGRYDAALPAPGRFDVWFERDGLVMLGNEREVTVTAGANYVDFDLRGATLKVMLKGWTRRAPVDVSVRPLNMSRPGKTGQAVRVRPADPLPVVFSGLAYAKYAVQAREHSIPGQDGDRVAGATVILEDAQSEAEIELVLAHSRGILRVLDEAGVPIAGATVTTGEEHLMQTSPGVFSLGHVVPASSVVVAAPGFTPVIRLVASESPFDVRLTRGKQVRLRFVGGNPPTISGSLLWPGTESPVPLHLFAVARAADGTGDFIVQNFPAVPGAVYKAGPFDQPEQYQALTADANGVILIR